jgi:hypothetical protein
MFKEYKIHLIFLVISLPVLITVMFWTDRNIEFVIQLFKGTPTEIPFWLSAIVITLGLNVLILRNIEFVISLFKGSPTDIPFWLTAIVTLGLNVLILPFNVICELLRFI